MIPRSPDQRPHVSGSIPAGCALRAPEKDECQGLSRARSELLAVCLLFSGWMDRWVFGCMDGWMDGWMDGRMN